MQCVFERQRLNIGRVRRPSREHLDVRETLPGADVAGGFPSLRQPAIRLFLIIIMQKNDGFFLAASCPGA